MPFPQITDVPLTDQQRLVTARCVHVMREMMLAHTGDWKAADELTVLKAIFLGPDLKLPIETPELGL